MARHASVPSVPSVPRSTARRALLAVATAGVALGVGATTASADVLPAAGGGHRIGQADPQAAVRTLTGTAHHVTGPVVGLKPNPLAGTGVDPLDNGVGTQVADFRPLDTRMLTGPVAQAPSIGGIPVAGQALRSVR
ncbi:hypothetical protein C1I97_23230 [Streptomyces sp. NTH33]|uniref:hypothetical protein n=1 Tax=Streptomyces sp. NTH33 TaxID=1735453 RepID=UPI000DA8C5C5|nr:hypothetical protein [Streptomyces sp. NTH33]PZH00548.1 hypothetical protein C1I97_23230 [Streptomyces sp. NTH33]